MSQRKPVIAGNWKMNKTIQESQEFVAALSPEILHEERVEMIVCAPFIDLPNLQAGLNKSRVHWGGQNLYHEPSGAYTGEISASMLLSCGCSHVIIGHSERREYFQESDALVNLKVKAAMDAGLNPILCVGESLSEREAGGFEEKILSQVELGLAGVSLTAGNLERVLIAYEPIWAIGTGKTCDEVEANRILSLIRNKLAQLYGEDKAQGIRLLYGGSVKPETIAAQIQQKDLDGALVGGASLKPESFSQLVQITAQHT